MLYPPREVGWPLTLKGWGLLPCSGKGRLRMKRILSLVVVALVVAAIMLATGMPAYAGGGEWSG